MEGSAVSPLQEIICVVDRPAGLVQIYEEHSRGVCRGAAAWTAYHYRNTSELVIDSYRDGPRDVLLIKLGRGELKLKPSFSSAGIEEASLIEDGKKVEVVYAGLGGAGYGVTQCRKDTKGVECAEILDDGGGGKLGRCRFHFKAKTKLHIGIDDTDSKDSGATWALGNELGYEMGQQDGVSFLNHTLVQLYPFAPGKTTNCVSTVLTFAVEEGMKEDFIERFAARLKEASTSDQTGMAVFEGIVIPDELKQFTQEARTRIVKLDELDEYGSIVKLFTITGKQGLIGALGALGMAEDHENAVVPGIEIGDE